MRQIKNRYGLCDADDNLYESLKISGISNISDPNPGYIYAPYIVINSPTTIVSEGWFDMNYWRRLIEVEKRRDKIQKIKNKLWNNM
jgi:hypothetical protein